MLAHARFALLFFPSFRLSKGREEICVGAGAAFSAAGISKKTTEEV